MNPDKICSKFLKNINGSEIKKVKIEGSKDEKRERDKAGKNEWISMND